MLGRIRCVEEEGPFVYFHYLDPDPKHSLLLPSLVVVFFVFLLILYVCFYIVYLITLLNIP